MRTAFIYRQGRSVNDLTCSPSTVLITLILGNRLAVYIIGWYALSRTLGGVW